MSAAHKHIQMKGETKTTTNKQQHMTYGNGGFLRSPFFGGGVKQDISATPLAVLVHYQPDLTGLQLGKWPAKWEE